MIVCGIVATFTIGESIKIKSPTSAAHALVSLGGYVARLDRNRSEQYPNPARTACQASHIVVQPVNSSVAMRREE